MNVILSKSSEVFHEFLSRACAKSVVRPLSQQEVGLVLSLRDTAKSMNICITELLLVKRVILKLQIRPLQWVCRNFDRIVNSLLRQRNLVCAARKAIMVEAPTAEEWTSIRKLQQSVENRLQYLRDIPIAENIRLTPLQDYIDLVGEDQFLPELRKAFPSAMEMYQAQRNAEQLTRYADHILAIVREAGREDVYLERLSVYLERLDRRKQADMQEKLEEKIREARSESENGIMLMRELFSKGVRTLEGSPEIGLSSLAVKHHMHQGDRGRYCILCCGFYRDHLQFRYVRQDGVLLRGFGNVGLYQTYDEAQEAMKVLDGRYPDKAFAVAAL